MARSEVFTTIGGLLCRRLGHERNYVVVFEDQAYTMKAVPEGTALKTACYAIKKGQTVKLVRLTTCCVWFAIKNVPTGRETTDAAKDT